MKNIVRKFFKQHSMAVQKTNHQITSETRLTFLERAQSTAQATKSKQFIISLFNLLFEMSLLAIIRRGVRIAAGKTEMERVEKSQCLHFT